MRIRKHRYLKRMLGILLVLILLLSTQSVYAGETPQNSIAAVDEQNETDQGTDTTDTAGTAGTTDRSEDTGQATAGTAEKSKEEAQEENSADDTGQIENRTGETTLSQLEELTGVSFTVEAVKEAGITDQAFAQAVYDAIVGDPNNFCVDITEDRNDNVISSTPLSAQEVFERGKEEGLTDGIKIILSYFTGDIDAVGDEDQEKVKAIDGIKNLRRAHKIDLYENEITDLMELKRGENYIEEIDVTDANLYFGEGGVVENKGRNVHIYVSGNPIAFFPSELDGRLTLDITAERETVFPKVSLVYALSDQLTELSAEIPVTVKYDGNTIVLDGYGIRKIGSSLEETRSGENQNEGAQIKDAQIGATLKNIELVNIKQSEEFSLDFSSDSKMTMYTIASGGSSITPTAVSFKWKVPVALELYSNVTVSQETTGAVKIKKVAEDGETPLEGAKFTLYNDKNEVVKENLISDTNGEVEIEELEPGSYYLKEVESPDGYYGDPDEKHEFTISDGKVVIKNTSRNTSTDDGDTLVTQNGTTTTTETLADGVYVLGGGDDNLELDIGKPDGSKLKSLTVNWTAGSNGGTAGSETFDTGTEENIKDEALAKIRELAKNYQNVTVKAVFVSDLESAQVITVENKKTGSLQLSKKVVNNDGTPSENTDTEFEFTIDLTKNGKKLTGTYPYEITKDGSPVETGDFSSGGKINLKNGETLKIDNLPGDTAFTITETSNPAYKVSGTVTVNDEQGNQGTSESVNGGTFNGEIYWGQQTGVDVTNTLCTYKLSVRKQDDGKQPLEDAEFTLYRPAEDGEVASKEIEVNGEQIGIIVAQIKTTALVEGSNPKIAAALFEDLTPGTVWYLEETDVPTGYHKMEDMLVVEISDDGDMKVIGQDVHKVEGSENEYYITLTNYGNISIPMAGMKGIGIYTITGLLLISVAAVGAAGLSRRRRKR